MAAFIPLIRAAAVMPWVRWLRVNKRPVMERMRAADIGYFPTDDPNWPVPALNIVEFARQQARLEGCDLSARVVSNTTLLELENLGLAALSGRTVADALLIVAKVMPRHCTHEVITVEQSEDGLLVSEFWHWDFDPEARHLIQLYVAAVIQSLCTQSGIAGPMFSALRLTPHPTEGLRHVHAHFLMEAQPVTTTRLEIAIPNRVAEARLAGRLRRDVTRRLTMTHWDRLRTDTSMATSARMVIEAMLADGVPTVERLAFSGGTSVRSLQRQLAQEGTSFSDLLDEVRQQILKQRLAAGVVNLGQLSAELGYANSSAFTRAVRRWTGRPPRELLRD